MVRRPIQLAANIINAKIEIVIDALLDSKM
ncbi:uncharacterized protein METZ01_LOCUS97609 [marine metagenome]|uniref:Uncharacterized protein n=1 Tax=marine metagenome TaxID=408172 RepID=A0A381VWW6_9ZZZZ